MVVFRQRAMTLRIFAAAAPDLVLINFAAGASTAMLA